MWFGSFDVWSVSRVPDSLCPFTVCACDGWEPALICGVVFWCSYMFFAYVFCLLVASFDGWIASLVFGWWLIFFWCGM